jgi:hypothetical protein
MCAPPSGQGCGGMQIRDGDRLHNAADGDADAFVELADRKGRWSLIHREDHFLAGDEGAADVTDLLPSPLICSITRWPLSRASRSRSLVTPGQYRSTRYMGTRSSLFRDATAAPEFGNPLNQ